MSVKRQRRPYEVAALVAARQLRQFGLFWTRRGRKSTNLGNIAFDELSKGPNRMVIAASASLLLGTELVASTLNSLSDAEQKLIVESEAEALRSALESNAAESNLKLQVADASKDKVLRGVSDENFTDLYRSRKLELRLQFSPTSYSRLLVIAPDPARARSWRALVIFDEYGYIRSLAARQLRDAVDPMMRDTQDLKIIYACNLPLEDTHPWFTMTLPRDITASNEDEQFPADPRGHFYIGQEGITIHRVALKDAYAAGHLLYDDRGKAMTYEEARVFPQIRSGFDVSYGLIHKPGGAAVVDLIALITSQQRGANNCAFVEVDSDADFERALRLLAANLSDAEAGVGFDVATTTSGTSNPSCVCVTEKRGLERRQPLMVIWKERKPQVARERFGRILDTIAARPRGGPAKRFCIDGSNERYFAEETVDIFRAKCPGEVIIAGSTVDPQPAGYDDKVNYKTYTGDGYATAINDNHYSMASAEYLKVDHRMVLKDGGRYVCVPAPDGKHGDTFDGGKLGELAVMDRGVPGNIVAFETVRSKAIATRRERSLVA